MTSFRDQNFTHRFAAMGDEAEAVFEEVHNAAWIRYGLNRPPLRMSSLSPFVRYTPDYLTSTSFVEVQGVGRDRKLKLKYEKKDALDDWDYQFPVELFVWDKTMSRFCYLDWETVKTIYKKSPTDSFPEGKKYKSIDIDNMIGGELWVAKKYDT